MYEKYRAAAFGRCPRVFCQGQPVLPVGLSDLPRNYTVNVFCPRCHGLFFPKSTRQANIDGAYFGTTFPHLYLMTHPVSSRYTMILSRYNLQLLLNQIILDDLIYCCFLSSMMLIFIYSFICILYLNPRTWFPRDLHKHTFLECMVSKFTNPVYFTKIMKRVPKNPK